MTRPAMDYVPHRGPMLLLDELLADDEQSVVCRTTIRPDCIFLDGGVVSPLVMIELVAQACAVYVGVKASREGRPPQVGMIVGCREAEFLVDKLVPGDELTVTVIRNFGQQLVATFSGTVARGEAVLARIMLSVVDAEVALGPVVIEP